MGSSDSAVTRWSGSVQIASSSLIYLNLYMGMDMVYALRHTINVKKWKKDKKLTINSHYTCGKAVFRLFTVPLLVS